MYSDRLFLYRSLKISRRKLDGFILINSIFTFLRVCTYLNARSPHRPSFSTPTRNRRYGSSCPAYVRTISALNNSHCEAISLHRFGRSKMPFGNCIRNLRLPALPTFMARRKKDRERIFRGLEMIRVLSLCIFQGYRKDIIVGYIYIYTYMCALFTTIPAKYLLARFNTAKFATAK